MSYTKPSKQRANEAYLKANGYVIGKPYEEEQVDQNKQFLIICEGLNTEPRYFEGFRIPGKTVIIEGGRNTKTDLVDYAIKEKDSDKYKGREVWCVFDFDIKPDEAKTQPEDFNNAIIKAEQNGLKTAWSNDAFELWFVLHYDKMDTPITRKELFKILKEKWQLESFHNEAKTDNFCKGHYSRHNENGASQKLAIRRAKELHEAHKGNRNFAEQCPCTTVYLLVEELNKYIKD
jgi:hypothetical protein